MSDLPEISTAQPVKVAGVDPATGIENFYVTADSIGRVTTKFRPDNTYSAAISGLVTAASATDILTIKGSATKTITITEITISGTTSAGSGTSINCTLVKRSTADTGGTSTVLTNAPYDSTNAAATATISAYTANPTLGTAVGNVRAFRLTIGPIGIASQPIILTLGKNTTQGIILRGVAEQLCINFSGGTITGPVISISIEWTET